MKHNRRSFLRTAALSIVTPRMALMGAAHASVDQPKGSERRLAPIKQLKAGALDIGYYEAGPRDGPPVLLLHGFPYSIESYVDVAPMLAARLSGACALPAGGMGPRGSSTAGHRAPVSKPRSASM
jgi:hypothetical protein